MIFSVELILMFCVGGWRVVRVAGVLSRSSSSSSTILFSTQVFTSGVKCQLHRRISNIIDGKAIAADIQKELKKDVQELQRIHNIVPTLAVVLVGTRKESQIYVKMKEKAAAQIGINFLLNHLNEQIEQKELVHIVQQLNNDKSIHGLIVQLPLPDHIEEKEVLDAISYEKDVDGFHPLNRGS